MLASQSGWRLPVDPLVDSPRNGSSALGLIRNDIRSNMDLGCPSTARYGNGIVPLTASALRACEARTFFVCLSFLGRHIPLDLIVFHSHASHLLGLVSRCSMPHKFVDMR
ncbi:hypothetical protein SERLADRAFT_474203 [Serpula lacrymans var. lacrymans S7.9]|uniref:Uncharacterized protein n=1 Tax=Serpula lacrymans var. lacrymans (strain S7.9) TaxID=578457 RepID=F8P4S6_SERL9|nr:uncharacterized protein SERLADRAFT_474203 [Serpula lacrymans var. lacrymans S7.9]EGO21613.1 hypothetical protein SERLADRAFT_474203 [Serpula lacrymans var. lacrymans S7.9]